MANYYRINVSKDGVYLFATEQGGITSVETARRVYILFMQKFPPEEGYKISVTYYRCNGLKLEW